MKNLKKFVCNLDVIISGLSLCAIVVIESADCMAGGNAASAFYICDFLRRKRGIPLRKPGKY